MSVIFTKRLRAFTLIELLIVVAIIAILAAIAVPNFLEAQTRSKVSRAKADMRTLLTGLEAYAVDYNRYPDVPRTGAFPSSPIKLGPTFSRAALTRLSTPVAYITDSYLSDPFAKVGTTSTVSAASTDFFGYANAEASTGMDTAAVGVSNAPDGSSELSRFKQHGFILQSVGPDSINYALSAQGGFPRAFQFLIDPTGAVGQDFIYDPTNGTISFGDIVRTREVNFR